MQVGVQGFRSYGDFGFGVTGIGLELFAQRVLGTVRGGAYFPKS